MEDSDINTAAAIAARIIRSIPDLGREDLPRPLLIRFAWFCAGAVFVLASVRLGPSGRRIQPEVDPQAGGESSDA